jgi:hypothetical protein
MADLPDVEVPHRGPPHVYLIPLWGRRGDERGQGRPGTLLRGWALVDAADYPEVARHRWHLDTRGYARTGRGPRLHRLLLGSPPAGLVCQHDNQVKLDNRRSNLHFVTKRENLERSGFWVAGCAAARTAGSRWVRAGGRPRPSHCQRGHPFDEGNTCWRSNGRRECRTCKTARNRARYR